LHHKRLNVWSGGGAGERWILLLLVGGAFALRAWGLDAQGLWRDEVDAWRFATAPLAELWSNFTRPGWNGPFYFLLLRGWVSLTGKTAYAMRYFSLLWGVVSVPLFYRLAQRLIGRPAALWATCLVIGSPYLVWYSQEVKMYTWVPALVLAALYALERACVRPRALEWLVVFVATSLAFYSHILAALLIPVEVVWFLLHPRRARRAWLGGVIVLVLLTLPYIPLLYWQAPLIFQQRETGFPAYTLGEMVGILLGGWSTGIAGWGGIAAAVGYGGLALLGLGGLVAMHHPRRALTLLLWVAVPLLIIWGVSLRGPIFTDRYLIWTAPAFYLAIGAGLALLRPLSRWGPLLGLTALLTVGGINLFQQVIQPIKPEFPAAVAYLETQRQPGELLLFQIPYNHWVVAYYATEALEPWAEAPFTNWRQAEGKYLKGPEYVEGEMQRIVGMHSSLWLIYTEVNLWDDRQLVKAWLDAHGTLSDERHWHLVDLYHYELAP